MSDAAHSAFKSAIPAIITCGLAGTVLAILAPYGTHSFSLIGRFAFWVGLCLAGGVGAWLTDLFSSLFKIELSPWARVFSQSITATIVVTLAMILMNLSIGATVSGSAIALLFFYVWVIAITISTIGQLSAKTPPKPNGPPPRAALFDRLPVHLQSADVYALSAEDHYVRVYTSRGEEMVLMRLGDAIKEIAPLEGLSPHRSWWVAKQGVEKLTKVSGKTEIHLKSEHIVPVSRNGAKTVKEAGWR